MNLSGSGRAGEEGRGEERWGELGKHYLRKWTKSGLRAEEMSNARWWRRGRQERESKDEC